MLLKYKLDEVANIESIMGKRPFICKKCGASFERTLPRFTSIYPLCDKCMGGLKVQESSTLFSGKERLNFGKKHVQSITQVFKYQKGPPQTKYM